MHLKDLIPHVHDHVQKYIDHGKEAEHEFVGFMKHKIHELTHKHDLTHTEQQELHESGLEHYNKMKPEKTENGEEKEMEPVSEQPEAVKETEVSEQPEIYLNHLDEEREVIEAIPLHEVSEMLLDHLEQTGLLNEMAEIHAGEKASANAKGFLNRIFVFKKLYSRKVDGEPTYYSKILAYPPANVVSDLFFALES